MSEPICIGSFWQVRPELRSPFDEPDTDGGAQKIEVTAVKDGWVEYINSGCSWKWHMREDSFRSTYECHHMPWQDAEYMLGLRVNGAFWKWLFSKESLRFLAGK